MFDFVSVDPPHGRVTRITNTNEEGKGAWDELGDELGDAARGLGVG